MSEHTPGRLYADKLQDRDACNVFAHGGTSALFTISPESTARRLVACWNACEPIADPENVLPRLLALNELAPDLEHQLTTMRAQRDELLAALRLAVRQNSHDMLMTGEELRQCETAIAKVEGGAA